MKIKLILKAHTKSFKISELRFYKNVLRADKQVYFVAPKIAVVKGVEGTNGYNLQEEMTKIERVLKVHNSEVSVEDWLYYNTSQGVLTYLGGGDFYSLEIDLDENAPYYLKTGIDDYFDKSPDIYKDTILFNLGIIKNQGVKSILKDLRNGRNIKIGFAYKNLVYLNIRSLVKVGKPGKSEVADSLKMEFKEIVLGNDGVFRTQTVKTAPVNLETFKVEPIETQKEEETEESLQKKLKEEKEKLAEVEKKITFLSDEIRCIGKYNKLDLGLISVFSIVMILTVLIRNNLKVVILVPIVTVLMSFFFKNFSRPLRDFNKSLKKATKEKEEVLASINKIEQKLNNIEEKDKKINIKEMSLNKKLNKFKEKTDKVKLQLTKNQKKLKSMKRFLLMSTFVWFILFLGIMYVHVEKIYVLPTPILYIYVMGYIIFFFFKAVDINCKEKEVEYGQKLLKIYWDEAIIVLLLTGKTEAEAATILVKKGFGTKENKEDKKEKTKKKESKQKKWKLGTIFEKYNLLEDDDKIEVLQYFQTELLTIYNDEQKEQLEEVFHQINQEEKIYILGVCNKHWESFLNVELFLAIEDKSNTIKKEAFEIIYNFYQFVLREVNEEKENVQTQNTAEALYYIKSLENKIKNK